MTGIFDVLTTIDNGDSHATPGDTGDTHNLDLEMLLRCQSLSASAEKQRRFFQIMACLLPTHASGKVRMGLIGDPALHLQERRKSVSA